MSVGKFPRHRWLGALAASLVISATSAGAAVGDFDTAFSGDGIEKGLVNGYQGEWRALLALNSGRVLVAGTAYYHPELRLSVPVSGLVAAYTAAGALDTTFGSNGFYLRSGAGTAASQYNDIARIGSSGKLLVAGTVDTPAKRIQITRLNANGSLDTTFGTGGHVVASQADLLSPRIVANIDGSFVVAAPRVGTGTGSGTVHVLAFSANGSVNPGFDSDGARELAFTGAEFTEQTSIGLALQGDGKVLVGATEYGGGGDIVVYRLNSNGSNDTGFDNMLINQDGRAVYSPGNSQEELHDIAVQADGRIIIVGAYRPTTTDTFRGLIVRATANGRWDDTFGSGGLVTTDFTDYNGEVFHRTLAQTDGDILVIGNAVVGTAYPQESRLLVARYNSNGSSDNAFGSGGSIVTGTPTLGACTHTFAAGIGSGGNVYVAGESTGGQWTNTACNSSGDFLLARQVGAPVVAPADTTPDAFSFIDRVDVARSVLVVSSAITITGIDAATPVSITNGAYSIGCTGTWTTAAGTVNNNQTICVRVGSASAYSTSVGATLSVGSISDIFAVTTEAAPVVNTDTTPDAFAFIDLPDMPSSVQVTSNSITVAGINAAAAISITGGEYSIGCGASFTAAAGTINNAAQVCVRHTTANGCAVARNTTLTIGGISDTFTSTTYDDTSDSDGDGVTDCSDSEPTDAAIASVRTASGQSLAIATAAGNLAGVSWQPATAVTNNSGLATDRQLAYGLLNYSITGLANGGSAVVTLTYPALGSSATLYKYTAADGFTDITANANVVISGGTVTLTLVDGGFGDADGAANGTIVDPLAVATPRPVAAADGGGGGCSLRSGSNAGIDPSLPVLAVLASLYLLRRRARAA